MGANLEGGASNLVLSYVVARLESFRPDVDKQRQGVTAPVVCLEDLSSPYAPAYNMMRGFSVFDPEWPGDVVESSCNYYVLLHLPPFLSMQGVSLVRSEPDLMPR